MLAKIVAPLVAIILIGILLVQLPALLINTSAITDLEREFEILTGSSGNTTLGDTTSQVENDHISISANRTFGMIEVLDLQVNETRQSLDNGNLTGVAADLDIINNMLHQMREYLIIQNEIAVEEEDAAAE